jgi:hypothetical protein
MAAWKLCESVYTPWLLLLGGKETCGLRLGWWNRLRLNWSRNRLRDLRLEWPGSRLNWWGGLRLDW